MFQTRIFRKLLACWTLIAAQAATVDADLIVNGFDADRHDRYNNSTNFVGQAFDLSGIGRVATGGRWATLISPSYFLSATHLHPGNSATVRFYESNDQSGGFVNRGIESAQQIAGTDLWLGKLDAAIGPSIHTYPIVAPGALVGQTIHVVGQDGATGMRMGRNVIDEVIPNLSGGGLASTGDVFTFDYDTDDGVGQDESWLQTGDSGGPSFAVVDGKLALVGIHWFIDFGDETSNALSGDTLVSSYLSEIGAAMDGESLTIVAIPEASAVWMGAIVVAGLVVTSHRAERRRSGAR